MKFLEIKNYISVSRIIPIFAFTIFVDANKYN